MNDRNKSTAHTTWNCKYHIVFAPKFRRKKREIVGKILRKLCEWKNVKIIAAEVCPDHIHMLVAIPPKLSGPSWWVTFFVMSRIIENEIIKRKEI